MGQLKIRETSAHLPDLPEEAQLTRATTLAGPGRLISRFEPAQGAVRAFDIGDTRLVDGRVRSLRADSSQAKGLNIRSVRWVSNVDHERSRASATVSGSAKHRRWLRTGSRTPSHGINCQ
jgi:hypothetical protein